MATVWTKIDDSNLGGLNSKQTHQIIKIPKKEWSILIFKNTVLPNKNGYSSRFPIDLERNYWIMNKKGFKKLDEMLGKDLIKFFEAGDQQIAGNDKNHLEALSKKIDNPKHIPEKLDVHQLNIDEDLFDE